MLPLMPCPKSALGLGRTQVGAAGARSSSLGARGDLGRLVAVAEVKEEDGNNHVCKLATYFYIS